MVAPTSVKTVAPRDLTGLPEGLPRGQSPSWLAWAPPAPTGAWTDDLDDVVERANRLIYF